MTIGTTVRDRLGAVLRRWLPQREIFLRSNGELRFLCISTAMQLAIAGLIGLVIVVIVSATVAGHADAARERGRLEQQRMLVARRSAQVDAYSRSAAGIALDLEQRQHLIEELVTSRLGPIAAAPAPAKSVVAAKRTSSLLPDIDQMRRLDLRQTGFARQLAAAFDARSRRMETQLRGLGLNPEQMLARAQTAQGGPLEALPDGGHLMTPALRLLAESVARLGVLEDTLTMLPSALPTQARMVTSSYGVRRDPFTGAAAFHPGIDFVGSYGQPIMAAASGRVAFVGQRNGYGNCVEIDHGNGILTRYGHLSGFVAHVGAVVARGQEIARMGSTGRSTGTHLHFEVRVDGRAIDPRPFLEARRPDLGMIRNAVREAPGDGRPARARHA